tara:strand:- start:12984 stop:13835 length:852 start_codon:yes stop_codon:yes gene_type:complete
MDYSSEQQQLASLVGGDIDDKHVDHASMLESGLRKTLGGPSQAKIHEVVGEIEARGDYVTSNSSMPNIPALKEGSIEPLLLGLSNLRANLIAAFEGCKINTKTSEKISTAIREAESMINTVGGAVELFQPLQHVSGLKAPDFKKNANKVIETTKQCYSLGSISKTSISEDGTQIDILLDGQDGDIAFQVIGKITAEEWSGSEAIDYVYTPGEGKLSVKIFEDGRWQDRSASGRYRVLWDLIETDVNAEVEVADEKIEKIAESGKGETSSASNNVDEDIGDPID